MSVLVSSQSPAASGPTTQPRLIVGADISALAQLEDRGAVFRDHGQNADAIELFSRHGWNCFRLRLFVEPNGQGGVVNSLAYTRALAKRIKSAGAIFLLDLHYSDTWADPQHQVKPAAWSELPFDQLEARVESYTHDVISDLKRDDLLPDVVQIGNEITGGMLWPDGQVQVPKSDVKVFDGTVRPITPPQPYDDAKQWDQFARLLRAGVRGVRSATTPADNIRIMIHIDCGGDWPITRWFFDHLAEHGVEFDLIGQSYYPHWHGTLDNVRDNLRETAARYRKDIVIVETAYPWKGREYWSARRNMAWPISAAGQKKFMIDLLNAVRETPDGHGLGVVYWHPESVPPRRGSSTTRPWNGGAMALFDDDGNALPAISLMP